MLSCDLLCDSNLVLTVSEGNYYVFLMQAGLALGLSCVEWIMHSVRFSGGLLHSASSVAYT